jgi:Ni,Fe-hydrogenase III small subunit
LNESAPEEKEAPGCPPPPLLKILEDILHNRIKKKKTEMQKTQNRANITD